jgi:exopolysaccharide production protein ExoY
MEKPFVSIYATSANAVSRHLNMPQGGKRAIDVMLAVAFLILFAPLFAGVSLLLLVAQGRPILFRHKRIGRYGEPYECLKFRTMVNGGQRVLERHLATDLVALSQWETTRKLKDDPRVTPLGQLLRKLSLDELPQIINVLRGEMSLVGPRPITEEEACYYGPHITVYQSIRPGITGPWQVSGRSRLSFARRVEIDVDYVQNWSLARDVVILIRTLPTVMTMDGSY